MAVSVTCVPPAKFAAQAPVEQLTPEGLLVTVPFPFTVTESVMGKDQFTACAPAISSACRTSTLLTLVFIMAVTF